MKRFVSLTVLGAICLSVFGCGGRQSIKPAPGPDEKLIWSTHEKGRPVWTIKPSAKEKDLLFFVGQSEKFATEKGARDDALRDAMKKATVYINTLVMDKFQKLLASHNVSSQIADPTVVSREFEEQLSTALIKKMAVKEWYEEKWQDKLERVYWIAFLLSEVPLSSIDEAYRTTAQIEKEIMEKRYDEVLDKKAKEQFKAAMDAFDEAAKKGFAP